MGKSRPTYQRSVSKSSAATVKASGALSKTARKELKQSHRKGSVLSERLKSLRSQTQLGNCTAASRKSSRGGVSLQTKRNQAAKQQLLCNQISPVGSENPPCPNNELRVSSKNDIAARRSVRCKLSKGNRTGFDNNRVPTASAETHDSDGERSAPCSVDASCGQNAWDNCEMTSDSDIEIIDQCVTSGSKNNIEIEEEYEIIQPDVFNNAEESMECEIAADEVTVLFEKSSEEIGNLQDIKILETKEKVQHSMKEFSVNRNGNCGDREDEIFKLGKCLIQKNANNSITDEAIDSVLLKGYKNAIVLIEPIKSTNSDGDGDGKDKNDKNSTDVEYEIVESRKSVIPENGKNSETKEVETAPPDGCKSGIVVTKPIKITNSDADDVLEKSSKGRGEAQHTSAKPGTNKMPHNRTCNTGVAVEGDEKNKNYKSHSDVEDENVKLRKSLKPEDGKNSRTVKAIGIAPPNGCKTAVVVIEPMKIDDYDVPVILAKSSKKNKMASDVSKRSETSKTPLNLICNGMAVIDDENTLKNVTTFTEVVQQEFAKSYQKENNCTVNEIRNGSPDLVVKILDGRICNTFAVNEDEKNGQTYRSIANKENDFYQTEDIVILEIKNTGCYPSLTHRNETSHEQSVLGDETNESAFCKNIELGTTRDCALNVGQDEHSCSSDDILIIEEIIKDSPDFANKTAHDRTYNIETTTIDRTLTGILPKSAENKVLKSFSVDGSENNNLSLNTECESNPNEKKMSANTCSMSAVANDSAIPISRNENFPLPDCNVKGISLARTEDVAKKILISENNPSLAVKSVDCLTESVASDELYLSVVNFISANKFNAEIEGKIFHASESNNADIIILDDDDDDDDCVIKDNAAVSEREKLSLSSAVVSHQSPLSFVRNINWTNSLEFREMISIDDDAGRQEQPSVSSSVEPVETPLPSTCSRNLVNELQLQEFKNNVTTVNGEVAGSKRRGLSTVSSSVEPYMSPLSSADIRNLVNELQLQELENSVTAFNDCVAESEKSEISDVSSSVEPHMSPLSSADIRNLVNELQLQELENSVTAFNDCVAESEKSEISDVSSSVEPHMFPLSSTNIINLVSALELQELENSVTTVNDSAAKSERTKLSSVSSSVEPHRFPWYVGNTNLVKALELQELKHRVISDGVESDKKELNAVASQELKNPSLFNFIENKLEEYVKILSLPENMALLENNEINNSRQEGGNLQTGNFHLNCEKKVANEDVSSKYPKEFDFIDVQSAPSGISTAFSNGNMHRRTFVVAQKDRKAINSRYSTGNKQLRVRSSSKMPASSWYGKKSDQKASSGYPSSKMNSSIQYVFQRAQEELKSKKENEMDWTTNQVVAFSLSMIGYKPVGVNRHFMMLLIHNKFSTAINHEISSQVLWDHLDSLYDMAALNESEIIPFPNEEVDFELPEDCYDLLKSKYGVTLKSSESGSRNSDTFKAAKKFHSSKNKQSATTISTKASLSSPLPSKSLKSQNMLKNESKTVGESVPKAKHDSGLSTKINKVKRSSSPFSNKTCKTELTSGSKQDVSEGKKAKPERGSSPASLRKPVKNDNPSGASKKPTRETTPVISRSTKEQTPDSVKKMRLDKEYSHKKNKTIQSTDTSSLSKKNAKIENTNGLKKRSESEGSLKKNTESSSVKIVKNESKNFSHSSRGQESETPPPSGSRKSSPVVKAKSNDNKKLKGPRSEEPSKKLTVGSKRRRIA